MLVAGDSCTRWLTTPRARSEAPAGWSGVPTSTWWSSSTTAPRPSRAAVDDAIYEQKYRYLINPSLREEIDYTIKRLAKVREQVAFSTFRDMVSCKIVDESTLLYGSQRLFDAAKSLLAERDIPRELETMKQSAVVARETTEERLLHAATGTVAEADRNLFCGTEEVEEFD